MRADSLRNTGGADMAQLPDEVLLYLTTHHDAVQLPAELEQLADDTRRRNTIAKQAQSPRCEASTQDRRQYKRLWYRRSVAPERAI